MSIRASADSIHFSSYPAERAAANGLGEGFDITSADRHSNFSFWIAAPHDHLKERFGFIQELLVLYSPYPITDARALTALEAIADRKDLRLRIDRYVSLVVHAGDPNTTGALLSLHGDRVVVPFEVAQLTNPQRGNFFVRSEIAKALGGIDIFGMSSPITQDKDFFGREELVQTLTARALQKHESSGLFGLRKTGKTSVLFALERRVRDRNVIVEYIDCQGPGIHSMRWWQLLAEISERILRKTQISATKSAFHNKHLVGADAARGFSKDIALITSEAKVSLILLFDEIEYITHGLSGALGKHWDEDFHPFWATIRSTQQEARGQLTFIVAGVNPSCVETSHFGATQNPIFQLAIPQYLEPIRRENLRTMVRTLGKYGGLDFDEDVYQFLFDNYGGHPYLVRIACSEIWKAYKAPDALSNAKIGKSSFIEQRLAIRERLALPIREILLSLLWWYPEEYELLRLMAFGVEGDKEFIADYMRESPDQITQFVKYGVLRDDSKSFAILELQSFLVEHGLKYKEEVSPFSRTELPQSVIAEEPDLDLLGRLFTQKTELEISLRKLILMIVGVSVNFDPKLIADALAKGLKVRSDRRYPEDLFVGRQPKEVLSDLYTLDLKTIVLEHFDKFKAAFPNKQRFEMNMDAINKARRIDSHTKPLTKQECEDFSNSYHWMRQAMEPILANLPYS